jgi:hypothetical protein
MVTSQGQDCQRDIQNRNALTLNSMESEEGFYEADELRDNTLQSRQHVNSLAVNVDGLTIEFVQDQRTI